MTQPAVDRIEVIGGAVSSTPRTAAAGGTAYAVSIVPDLALAGWAEVGDAGHRRHSLELVDDELVVAGGGRDSRAVKMA